MIILFCCPFSGLPQVPEGLRYFPAMWFKSEVVLPEANAKRILSVTQLPSLVRTLALYLIGPVTVLTVAILCLILNQRHSCRRSSENQSNFAKVRTSDEASEEDLLEKDSSTIIKSKSRVDQVQGDYASSKLLSEKS